MWNQKDLMRTLLKVLVIFVFYLTPFYLSAKPVDIALDQVGYRIDDEKDFRVARQVAAFQIRDEQNSIVFEGKLSGPIHDQYAGCDVWRGVFTDLKTPGTYTVQMEGGDRSWPFRIGNDIYQPLLQAALRGLYVSRCGYAVKDDAVGHPPCHMRDGAFMLVGGKKIADGRDATGGWHNGGDYWRSTMSAAQTVSRLLWPVEMFPDSFDI